VQKCANFCKILQNSAKRFFGVIQKFTMALWQKILQRQLCVCGGQNFEILSLLTFEFLKKSRFQNFMQRRIS
jgi:hypothetical protein